MARRNALYQRYLLRRMREDALSPVAALSAAQREGARTAQNVVEFDERVTAPRNGFAGAAEYYARNSAKRFLGAVRAPMLVIHASDDPWIPSAAYTAFDWRSNPALTLLMSSGGGHVGFHGAGSPVAWHDRCAGQFVDQIVA
jgi:predicted alpha/beta-fold hydrolase